MTFPQFDVLIHLVAVTLLGVVGLVYSGFLVIEISRRSMR